MFDCGLGKFKRKSAQVSHNNNIIIIFCTEFCVIITPRTWAAAILVAEEESWINSSTRCVDWVSVVCVLCICVWRVWNLEWPEGGGVEKKKLQEKELWWIHRKTRTGIPEFYWIIFLWRFGAATAEEIYSSSPTRTSDIETTISTWNGNNWMS